MASFANHSYTIIFFFLTLLSSLYTLHARGNNNFFNKVRPTSTSPSSPPPSSPPPSPLEEEELPSFTQQEPQSNSHGLYGRVSTTTAPTKWRPKNYNPDAYVTKAEDVEKEKTPATTNFHQLEVEEPESYIPENFDPLAEHAKSKNKQNVYTNYNPQKSTMSTANEEVTDNRLFKYNNNKLDQVEEMPYYNPQGMSDTRFYTQYYKPNKPETYATAATTNTYSYNNKERSRFPSNDLMIEEELP